MAHDFGESGALPRNARCASEILYEVDDEKI